VGIDPLFGIEQPLSTESAHGDLVIAAFVAKDYLILVRLVPQQARHSQRLYLVLQILRQRCLDHLGHDVSPIALDIGVWHKGPSR
jgi:hypothetical protein